MVVGLGEEDFASLSPELIQKYTEQFKTPERFMQINGNIVVLPVPAEKQDLAYLPDRFETGERVQTPRGSFQVTAMSREQMEAAGYGVHHISDDGKYLIMGNGTRAFAVAAEQPEKDNPLRTAEMTLEDDYGMIDGVINNGRRGEESEKPRSTQIGQRRRSLPSVSGWRMPNGNVPSISPRRAKSPAVMCRSMTAYEPKQEMAAGMGVLSGRERQTAV